MRFLTTAAILLSLLVTQTTAGTRTARIVGDPMRRGEPEKKDKRPPLTPQELQDAKDIMYRMVLEGDINVEQLREAGAGLKRTLDDEEREDLQMSVAFLQNALQRTPKISPEEDDPNYPPAEDRYAARAKNQAYRRGQLGVIDMEERKKFEFTAKYTPAEKTSAILVRDEKTKLYMECKEALKKHESEEETLSDEGFEKYMKQLEELKAELEIHLPKKPPAGKFPGAKIDPPNAGAMPTNAKSNPTKNDEL